MNLKTDFLWRLVKREPAVIGERDEAGFTLIEMMTVLLIMAVLLAVALPTFLSVTNGAKKTAAQGNVVSLGASANALWASTLAFPATPVSTLAKTQKNFIIKGPTVTPTQMPTNALSVYRVNANAVIITAYDQSTVCWAEYLNLGTTITPIAGKVYHSITTPPTKTGAVSTHVLTSGTWYGGLQITAATATKCRAKKVNTNAAFPWVHNFKTLGLKQ